MSEPAMKKLKEGEFQPQLRSIKTLWGVDGSDDPKQWKALFAKIKVVCKSFFSSNHTTRCHGGFEQCVIGKTVINALILVRTKRLLTFFKMLSQGEGFDAVECCVIFLMDGFAAALKEAGQ